MVIFHSYVSLPEGTHKQVYIHVIPVILIAVYVLSFLISLAHFEGPCG